jgi:F-type H+-transporting ATPase subunit epsilon
MASFHFELVSPEKLVFSGEVDQVDAPGAEGDFGVLAGHAPFISALKPGVLVIASGGQRTRVVVSGGLAEVNPDGMTVLAEMATPVEELDPAMLAGAIQDATEDLEDAKDDAARDRIRQKLEQLKTLQAALAG